MRSVKYEFPNPVLATGFDDYKEDCEFSYTLAEDKIAIDSKNIVIPVSYTLKCRGLEKLVADGKATAVISAISPTASFSRIEKFGREKTEAVMKIPKFSVVTKIDITCFIIAAEAINEFSCEGELNELYFGGAKFEIRKGDILAAAERRTIYLDQNELERNITSVFTIGRAKDDSDQKRDVEPNFYGEKIVITLKSELYQLYYELKDSEGGQLRRCVNAIIVYPVLAEAIGYIVEHYRDKGDNNLDASPGNGPGVDFSGKRWFRNISAKMDELGIDPSSLGEHLVPIADTLFKGITMDALRELKSITDEDDGMDGQTLGMEE